MVTREELYSFFITAFTRVVVSVVWETSLVQTLCQSKSHQLRSYICICELSLLYSHQIAVIRRTEDSVGGQLPVITSYKVGGYAMQSVCQFFCLSINSKSCGQKINKTLSMDIAFETSKALHTS